MFLLLIQQLEQAIIRLKGFRGRHATQPADTAHACAHPVRHAFARSSRAAMAAAAATAPARVTAGHLPISTATARHSFA